MNSKEAGLTAVRVEGHQRSSMQKKHLGTSRRKRREGAKSLACIRACGKKERVDPTSVAGRSPFSPHKDDHSPERASTKRVSPPKEKEGKIL